MKLAITTALALMSLALPALAHEGGQFGTIACVQNPAYSPIKDKKIFAVVQQVSQSRVYQMIVSEKNIRTGERKVLLTESLFMTSADVMVLLEGKRANLLIYLDERNQANLTIGKKEITMICKTNTTLLD